MFLMQINEIEQMIFNHSFDLIVSCIARLKNEERKKKQFRLKIRIHNVTTEKKKKCIRVTVTDHQNGLECTLFWLINTLR